METTYKAIKEKPTTLIIHCLDPRFQSALNCFFNDLGLSSGQFVPIVVAGGPAALSNPVMTSETQCLSNQIVFLLRYFLSIKSIILINHENCGFYTKIPNPNGKIDREKNDLPIAARVVADLIFVNDIQDVEVKIFYAKFTNTDKGEIVFEKK